MDKLLLLLGAVLGCLLVADGAPTDPDAVTPGDPPARVKDRKTCMDYMKYYNHMGADATSDAEMMDALRSFQRMANIPETGEIDNATITKMNSDRCGVKDNMGVTIKERKRGKRYSADGRRWTKEVITWRVNSFTTDVGQQATLVDIMRRALAVWSDVTNLRFTQVTVPGIEVDFDIEFARGAHGDNGPFDGPGRVLAHAYFPRFPGQSTTGLPGDAHFDDDEFFTDFEPRTGTNLFQVAAHEFGHSLGLGHSEIEEALMAPYYRGYQANFQLHADDIAGIQYLYGPNTGQPDATMKPYPPTAGAPSCPGFDLDAVAEITTDGQAFATFFFKGSQLWQITSTGVAAGYPRSISSVFPGLPNDIDAAIYYQHPNVGREGRTYFFKGSSYYTYLGTNRQSGPVPIRNSRDWSGLPDNLDVALVWSGNGFPYFFKGNQYYGYNRNLAVNNRVLGPYPLSHWRIQDGNGQPVRFDAAFQWRAVNRRTYFFYQNQYLRFDDRNIGIDAANPTYPRNIGEWWFGCDSSAYVQGGDNDGDKDSVQGGDNGALASVLPSMILVALSAFLTVSLL